MRRSLKTLLMSSLLAAIVYLLPKFCAEKTDGFALLKIHSDLVPDKRWETALPPPNLKSLLNQPFTYLNSGGQSYVFLSEDKTLVVKFFKHHLRRLPWITAHLPLPAKYAALRERQREKRMRKLIRDFTSYKIAYEELREESGLLYVHLNKTTDLNQKLTIIDKLGISHVVDLDSLEFIVQKRADLALDHFHELVKAGKKEEARQAIDSLLDLLVSRCKKGIYDEDPRLHRNLGYIGSTAILIDIGRLKKDPTRSSPEVFKRDLHSITDRLNAWLLQEDPELSSYLEERLNAYH